MQLKRWHLALLAAWMVLNVALAGWVFLSLHKRAGDPMATREGFGAGDVRAPKIPTEDPNVWEERPQATAALAPGYSIESRWELGRAYAVWGGELRYWLRNTGSGSIFVYGFSIEGEWGAPVCASVGVAVERGEEVELGVLHFPGPDAPGDYGFTVRAAIMAQTRPGPLNGWYDYGWVSGGSRSVLFLPTGEPSMLTVRRNPAIYYDRLNRLLDPSDESVASKASELLSLHPGDYGLFHAVEAFEFVRREVKYVSDPEGSDDWAPPQETLRRGEGDCEDQALLLSALVSAMGGTARLHIEKGHIFASIFTGDDIEAAERALELYYNTDLRLAYFHDSYGYWLPADTTSSIHLGALPLGGQPVPRGWDLTNTTYHYIIDLLPR
ncbi:MAG: transglutaminase-like domain-containing protein [Thermoplasmatota archaeon]